MKRMFLLAAALSALAASADAAPKAPARPKSSGPVPTARAGAPGAGDWRAPDPNDVLVIDTNKGRIVVELTPETAPQFAERMRELAHEHFFDGQHFFRVIENFMDQTGDPQNTGEGGSTKPNVPAEFTFRLDPAIVTSAAEQAGSEIGFIKSIPVMTQNPMLAAMTKDGKVGGWALFCQGVAGVARAEDPDSANSQFFLMRAPYPSLEKRYAAFGRVIAGQDVVNAIKPGEPVPEPQDLMQRVRLLADLPPAERPTVRVIDPKSAWFKAEIARVRAIKGADFSACDVNIPAEVK